MEVTKIIMYGDFKLFYPSIMTCFINISKIISNPEICKTWKMKARYF